MKIFLSWSGKRSLRIAKELGKYLECMVPGLNVFLSDRDIGSGEPWNDRIHNALRDSKFGLLCVTTESLRSDWMIYEAGAIAHDAGNRVCAVLFDELLPRDLPKPLAKFQHHCFNKDEMRILAKNIQEPSHVMKEDIFSMI